MVEYLRFLHVIATDSHAILASIEPHRILDLSVRKGGISTAFGGNAAVDFFHIGSFRIKFSLILQTLKNCSKSA